MSDDRRRPPPEGAYDGVGSYDDPVRWVGFEWNDDLRLESVTDPHITDAEAETEAETETGAGGPGGLRPTRFAPGMSIRDVAEAVRARERDIANFHGADPGKWDSHAAADAGGDGGEGGGG